MEQSDIEDAAMFLLHLRTQRDRVRALPGELTPKTIDEAYEIQDATHRFGGWHLGMLKVGCTSSIAQQVLAIPHPIGGRIPTEGIFESGATVPAAFLGGTPLLECEIALRVGADNKVDAVAPAIELVDARFHDTSLVSGPSIVADNSAGCAAIIGTALDIDAVDLSDVAISLNDGESEIATGTAAALLDGPLGSAEWVLAHEASRGRAVAPGTWIITGTCTGLTPTEWGATYTADFGPLGSVGFTLGANS